MAAPKKKAPAKKRAPQDATLRNTRAANKRIAALEERVSALEKRLDEQF